MYNIVIAFGKFDDYNLALDYARETTKLLGNNGFTVKADIYETKPQAK